MGIGKKQHRKGTALIYATLCVMVLLGISSFAVDLGRAQCAKTELQNAVDAAARYASTGLQDSTTLTKAQAAANENMVDGAALAIQAGDVETGTWNSATKTFTVTASNPNAVRITGRRTTARGNALNLYFAGLFGRPRLDVTASAVALMTGTTPNYKMVGINSVSLAGSSSIAANTGEAGTASVACNGTWSVGGSITGDVLYRGSAPTGTITGTKSLMGANATFTTPTTPAGVASMGDLTINSAYYCPAGTYVVNNLAIIGGSWDIQGDADIYVTGNLTFSGSPSITNSASHRVRVFMTGASPTFSFGANATMCMSLYAPTASCTISGGTVIGTVVGKSLSMSGSAKLRYDSDWPVPTGCGGGGAVGAGLITTVE